MPANATARSAEPGPRARSLGLGWGTLPPGPRNAITDVPGVRVGHRTLHRGDAIRTGVTAILPQDGNLFHAKVPAASQVLNGFGKSIGLMQVDELGQLETPILLTNTFGVAACAEALIRDAIAGEPRIGRDLSTVNPVVLECNDGYLNDIQAMAVTPEDAAAALAAARAAADGGMASGAVGAGTGMSCFGLKGGIGTASRRLGIGQEAFCLGALVLANFGAAGDLRLPDGRRVAEPDVPVPERGSVIVVLATDIPLEHRQLRRIAARAGTGIAWTGSFWGHGSGDIALAFSTAGRLPHEGDAFLPRRVLAESRMDQVFRAAAEATAEAVMDALAAADTTMGFRGHCRRSLREVLAPR
ncbi:DmpA family aminopeptidase [Teichococcus vastitatis]|uniref:P1 family peptidase n=1 Tax=Teichococcus vastitatis TaxID=2307076 RepID=A0ABS9VZ25_9PROT|nr:P1 family peptidase [Pseudoroseomonas vastitatis]MCI0752241.1 P1 family peptidase [Pseudoroseomonas vastitatis]